MKPKQIVVGSGPAGVSCAKALLAQGCQVLMVDGGANLEPENAQKLVALSKTPPAMWRGNATAWMRDGMQSAVEGIPLKLTYGSDYPYRAMPGAPLIEGEGVNMKFSMGKGGFSAVWGTSVMPFRQEDMGGWPLSAEELAPHYRSVLDFMPVAQASDTLEALFPTFGAAESGTVGAMPLSAQANALLETMNANQRPLRDRGVFFGRSRLAVNATGRGAQGACTRCALCMYGCPYELLYTTARTVDAMRSDPNFTYLPGRAVQRVEEGADGVRVHAILAGGDAEVITGDRVFVGSGVLASAVILLRSLEAYDTAVYFRESHYFLLPMLRLRSVKGFERGNLHTLAQLFLEVLDETVSPNTIHLQTYTYNDLFEQPIAQKLGPAAKVFPWQAFLSRLYLQQGYLHSDESPMIEGRLQHRGNGDALTLKAILNPRTEGLLKRLVAKLLKVRGLTGLIPLTPLMREGEPGRGFHMGCSFPMQASPAGFGSDLLGRPAGLKRVHMVDSSVLPSIPATTITFSVMANAYRIGTLVGRGDV